MKTRLKVEKKLNYYLEKRKELNDEISLCKNDDIGGDYENLDKIESEINTAIELLRWVLK